MHNTYFVLVMFFAQNTKCVLCFVQFCDDVIVCDEIYQQSFIRSSVKYCKNAKSNFVSAYVKFLNIQNFCLPKKQSYRYFQSYLLLIAGKDHFRLIEVISAGIYKIDMDLSSLTTFEDILNFKKEEIKSYLKSENLKTSGSKQELARKVFEHNQSQHNQTVINASETPMDASWGLFFHTVFFRTSGWMVK